MARLFLLSTDNSVIEAFSNIRRQFPFDCVVGNTVADAQRILRSENYDAIVIDCDDLSGSKPLLTSLRTSATNKNSVIIAILNGGTAAPDALDLGANSTLDKPLALELLKQRLKSTWEALTKRQHQRINVAMPVYLSFGDTQDRLATALNISKGGMALRCQSPLDSDEAVRVKFQFPGSNMPVIARAEIAWSDARGFAGLRFVAIITGSDALSSWIEAVGARK